MLFAAIIFGVVGMLLLVFGLLIWKKQRISLLHDYHYDKVKEEDKEVFCKWSGIGVCLIGLGILVAGVVAFLTESPLSMLVFGAGFVVGLGMLIYAGVRYNR